MQIQELNKISLFNFVNSDRYILEKEYLNT